MNFDTSNQNNNGLLRFRSAPSSVLQSLTNEKVKDLNDRLSNNVISNSFQDLQEEVDGYSLNSQLQPYSQRQSTSPASIGCTSSYSRDVSSSIVMDNLSQQTKMGSSLLRQNSSPAGLFSHLNHQNGYGGNYRAGNNGDLSPSSSMFKGQISNFPSGVTSLGTLSRISEIEPENVEPSVLNDTSGYPFGSWEHESSSHFNGSFNGLKRELDDNDDDDGKLFGVPQNGDIGNHPHMLSQHLSLPKMQGERAAMEKLLHFQDSVPCKIRAKRGCATHPRSIAERLRRTRISERMRKLQDIVPNMEKQTNTADMLDLAVDYIKGLQKEYKALSDLRAKCRCSAKFFPNRTI